MSPWQKKLGAVAEDPGKQEEDQFEFDSAGEALGYIGMDQALRHFRLYDVGNMRIGRESRYLAEETVT